jgi:hypothetical protein
MSIATRVDKKMKAVTILVEGRVTPEEVASGLSWLDSDPEGLVNNKLILVEARGACGDAISLEQMRAIVEHWYSSPRLLTGAKMAFVAPDPYGRSSEFAAMMKDLPSSTIVFGGLDTACKWLGLDQQEVGRTLEDLRIESNNSRKKLMAA